MLTRRSGRIRDAHKLTRRAGRVKAGLFLAEGAQAVREAVAAGPGRVVEIMASESARDRHPAIVADAEEAGIAVTLAADDALADLSETVTPQGLVAVCRSLTLPLDDALPAAPGLVAVLAGAQDPGNAGTVIRCADAAGADAVVLTSGSVDAQGGKAVRASAGSVFHLPISADTPAEQVIAALRGRGVTVLAADGTGRQDLDAVEDAGVLAGPTAWLFGNEARGVPDEVLHQVDQVVRVPIYGRAESLNLAAAAAVCLYASARSQRRPRTSHDPC
ncbi:TrmH family RNA methyltransferase [Haloactinopolyspora alba]|uniref:TrmH family RNA methyltransferase n=1 Tax=Haloactinopolyspora alba TaxID=648780 RepID=A0A2P8DEC7_9ACTN|nr:RNA methyltransferase [Haloactinopolyspora alba]PSK95539.1 TrmH family RNA methyltransferase [Haloactinopolyspora alba]